MKKTLKIFKNGSNWLKADFHLHTNADDEFNYQGDSNFFVKNYLNKLEQEHIKIGVITNHNKFFLITETLFMNYGRIRIIRLNTKR